MLSRLEKVVFVLKGHIAKRNLVSEGFRLPSVRGAACAYNKATRFLDMIDTVQSVSVKSVWHADFFHHPLEYLGRY
jgi:hypothetical protein